MHNKTAKFITQLRHATQWRTTQHSDVSVVDHCRWNPWMRRRQPDNAR